MFSDVALYPDTSSAVIILSNTRDGFSDKVRREIEGLIFQPKYQPSLKKAYISMGKWLEQGLTGEQIINRIKANEPDLENYMVDQRELNRLGYFFVREKRINEALVVFAFNTNLYPYVANTHDSYGETLIASGQFKAGVAAYKKALEVEPNYANALHANKMIAKYGGTNL